TCYHIHKGSFTYSCKEKLCLKISKNYYVPAGAYFLKVPGPPPILPPRTHAWLSE
ncbi:hypothetical protein STEG23_020685, partial [Scotinomys teguina]